MWRTNRSVPVIMGTNAMRRRVKCDEKEFWRGFPRNVDVLRSDIRPERYRFHVAFALCASYLSKETWIDTIVVSSVGHDADDIGV